MEEDFYIVKKCLNNDTEAFGILIDKYERPIYNLGMRMLGNSDDAQDLTQNVFLKSWEKLNTYDSKYKFFSWIYRIAVNEALSYSKREKIKERIDDEESYSGKGSVDCEYEEFEQSIKIHEALLEIDINYRVVIVLKHYMELSYADIAELIQIPEKTVKSRLFSARQLLKNSLVKKGILNHEK